MRSLLFSMILTGAPYFSVAQTPTLPSSMWDDGCTVQGAFEVTMAEQLIAQSERRGITLNAMGQMMTLMNQREWDEGKPMADQMSAMEAVSFEQISQTIQNGQLVELIEGKRERDLHAIFSMANIATQVSAHRFDVSDLTDREQIHLAFLASAEEMMELDDGAFAEIKTEGLCTFENAIYVAAAKAYDRAYEVYGWEQAQAELEALSKKYGGGQLDATSMSAADREKLEQDIRPVLETVMNRANLGSNLLRLGIIEKVSKVRHQTMRLDQYDAPGNLEYMGTNWTRIFESSDFTSNEVLAAQILYQLNEIVPADIMEAWSAMDHVSSE